MWSIGALLELDDRAKMSEFLATDKEIASLDLPVIPPGSEHAIFDYLVAPNGQYTDCM